MPFGLNISWQIDGDTMESVTDFILGGSKITADGFYSHEINRCLLHGRKAVTDLDSMLKSRDITLPTKVYLVKAMVFPVVMYGCESCTIKRAECWRSDAFACGVGGDSWESLGLQEIQPVNPKGYQSWKFIGRSDAEAETPFHWPPDVKNWLFGKYPVAGKDWRQEEKDEMVGWHRQPDRHEFEQAPGGGDGQGILTCWSPWVTKSQTWLRSGECRFLSYD